MIYFVCTSLTDVGYECFSVFGVCLLNENKNTYYFN